MTSLLPLPTRALQNKPARAKPDQGLVARSKPACPRRRILLAMEWLDYELNMGIAEYALSAGWLVDDVASHTGEPPASWKGDGILCLLRHPDSAITRYVRSASVPVVDLVAELADIDLPRVLADNVAIGRTAAEHLISCGMHDLAFLNLWDSQSEQERMHGFHQAVERAGRAFHPILFHSGHSKENPSQEMLAWLQQKLIKLPKPLGTMGQSDREALYVIQACELAGLHVPEEVAVVGSDNDPLLCELGPVPLSSVDNRKRDQGFQAATLLDQLISGHARPHSPIRVPSGPVIIRYSSEVLAVSNPDLSKALRYIADNYHRPSIRVQHVVRHVDVPRRRLYSLFEEHLGRPIHAEILRRRLDLAKRLLLTTRQKLYSIARACGFQGAPQLTRVFTREVGISPSRYRQREGIFAEEKPD
jgi:LacI family transcriptional regulator